MATRNAATKVTIETRTVGTNFGHCAWIRSAATGRKLAESGVCGIPAAAVDAAKGICERRGYVVVEVRS